MKISNSAIDKVPRFFSFFSLKIMHAMDIFSHHWLVAKKRWIFFPTQCWPNLPSKGRPTPDTSNNRFCIGLQYHHRLWASIWTFIIFKQIYFSYWYPFSCICVVTLRYYICSLPGIVCNTNIWWIYTLSIQPLHKIQFLEEKQCKSAKLSWHNNFCHSWFRSWGQSWGLSWCWSWVGLELEVGHRVDHAVDCVVRHAVNHGSSHTVGHGIHRIGQSQRRSKTIAMKGFQR